MSSVKSLRRSFMVMVCFALLGMSTARFERYEVKFDSKTIAPNELFDVVADYIQSNSFSLESKIEEVHPKNQIAARFQRGPVTLTLVLIDNSVIEINGSQWRPGCTRIKEIAYLKEAWTGLKRHARERLGVDIEIQQKPNKL